MLILTGGEVSMVNTGELKKAPEYAIDKAAEMLSVTLGRKAMRIGRTGTKFTQPYLWIEFD